MRNKPLLILKFKYEACAVDDFDAATNLVLMIIPNVTHMFTFL